jgi:hypothetical protein
MVEQSLKENHEEWLRNVQKEAIPYVAGIMYNGTPTEWQKGIVKKAITEYIEFIAQHGIVLKDANYNKLVALPNSITPEVLLHMLLEDVDNTESIIVGSIKKNGNFAASWSCQLGKDRALTAQLLQKEIEKSIIIE